MKLNKFIFHTLNLRSPWLFSSSFPTLFSFFSLSSVNYFKFFGHFLLNEFLAMDWPSRKRRFQLLSLFTNISSLPEKFFLERKTSYTAQSLVNHFSSSLWLEREIFDLFGVFFQGHKDLRRILTDYGFPSFPLRKDFPLTGYYEIGFSSSSKSISQWNVVFSQSLRRQTPILGLEYRRPVFWAWLFPWGYDWADWCEENVPRDLELFLWTWFMATFGVTFCVLIWIKGIEFLTKVEKKFEEYMEKRKKKQEEAKKKK